MRFAKIVFVTSVMLAGVAAVAAADERSGR
jgi:hypothetical protein